LLYVAMHQPGTTVMPPVEAAAILILPSFVTNVWQMLAGPSLRAVIRRLWPMMLASCFGPWAGLGFMTGATARYGAALLGIALALYAVTETVVARAIVRKSWFRPWVCPSPSRPLRLRST
jgi:hypothetical protein